VPCIPRKEGMLSRQTSQALSLMQDMKDLVHMLLEGTIAELIAKLELSIYRKYNWHNKKGKPILYV